MMSKAQEERFQNIMKSAYRLGWIFPPQEVKLSEHQGQLFYNRNPETGEGKKTTYISYELMILSEVEKCMISMVDDSSYFQYTGIQTKKLKSKYPKTNKKMKNPALKRRGI